MKTWKEYPLHGYLTGRGLHSRCESSKGTKDTFWEKRRIAPGGGPDHPTITYAVHRKKKRCQDGGACKQKKIKKKKTKRDQSSLFPVGRTGLKKGDDASPEGRALTKGWAQKIQP